MPIHLGRRCQATTLLTPLKTPMMARCDGDNFMDSWVGRSGSEFNSFCLLEPIHSSLDRVVREECLCGFLILQALLLSLCQVVGRCL